MKTLVRLFGAVNFALALIATVPNTILAFGGMQPWYAPFASLLWAGAAALIVYAARKKPRPDLADADAEPSPAT